MGWPLVAAAVKAGAGILQGKANRKAAAKQAEADKEMYNSYINAARPNMELASGATQTWDIDDKGRWSGRQAFGPEEQARRDSFNQMMGSRMNLAAGQDLSRYNTGMSFANNPLLQQYQRNAGGPNTGIGTQSLGGAPLVQEVGHFRGAAPVKATTMDPEMVELLRLLRQQQSGGDRHSGMIGGDSGGDGGW